MHFFEVFCDSYFFLENVSTHLIWHCLECHFRIENHIDPVSQPPSWWLAVCPTTSTTTMSHIFFLFLLLPGTSKNLLNQPYFQVAGPASLPLA